MNHLYTFLRILAADFHALNRFRVPAIERIFLYVLLPEMTFQSTGTYMLIPKVIALAPWRKAGCNFLTSFGSQSKWNTIHAMFEWKSGYLSGSVCILIKTCCMFLSPDNTAA
jgi:hypothetical protein